MQAATTLIRKFEVYLINPAILVVFAAGFFLFVWGLVLFLMNIEEGGKREEGKKHMIWGIVGMLVMVSVYGIIALLNNTFGLGIDPSTGTYTPDIQRINNVTGPVNFF